MNGDPSTIGLLVSGYAAMGGVVIYIFRWAVGVAKEKDAALAAAKKEHTEDLKAIAKLQEQSVRATDAHAETLRELGRASDRIHRGQNRNTEVFGDIFRELVRQAMKDPEMRRKLSGDGFPAVALEKIQSLRDDREDP